MNTTLWIIAGFLATGFLIASSTKLFIPREKLAQAPGGGWVLDFSAAFVKALGAVEFLGAAGLILPALLHIAPATGAAGRDRFGNNHGGSGDRELSPSRSHARACEPDLSCPARPGGVRPLRPLVLHALTGLLTRLSRGPSAHAAKATRQLPHKWRDHHEPPRLSLLPRG